MGELADELLGYKGPESKSVCVAFGEKSASSRGESEIAVLSPFPKETSRNPKGVHCFLLVL